MFFVFPGFSGFFCRLFFIYFITGDDPNVIKVALFILEYFCNASVCLIPVISIRNVSLSSSSFTWEYEIF
jgi:hypothetical protein